MAKLSRKTICTFYALDEFQTAVVAIRSRRNKIAFET